jgi:hypothetical protein
LLSLIIELRILSFRSIDNESCPDSSGPSCLLLESLHEMKRLTPPGWWRFRSVPHDLRATRGNEKQLARGGFSTRNQKPETRNFSELFLDTPLEQD